MAETASAASKPGWIRAKAPGGPEYLRTRGIIERLGLHTVCREAHCPNAGECWAARTATFLILGDTCTRACRFCAINKLSGGRLPPPDADEPARVAEAAAELGLKHAVITSVTRDDLPDFGAAHFAASVAAINKRLPGCKVELLIPDMRGARSAVETVMRSGVDVLNHNLETVPRLYAEIRPGADYSRSLSVLRWAKEISPHTLTKSGIMIGLGESMTEVLELMDDLRACGADIITIGQYLRPSPAQAPVARYAEPAEFNELEQAALRKGFRFAECGPLVRSSYHAWRHTAQSAL